MITYDVNLCIGIESQGKNVVVKCHDTGVNLRVWLSVLHQKTWRAETEPYIIPEGATAVLKIAKPDKTFVLVDGVITSGYISFEELPPQAFTAAGTSKAEVSLFDANGRRLTTATFEIEVPKECVCDCKAESKTYVDIMAKQIQAAIDAEVNAKESAESAEKAANRAEEAAAMVDADAVQEAIDTALQKAKDSGEFDGKDGEPGKDAEVTTESISEALGYTPLSGKGAKEGQIAVSDGKDGLRWENAVKSDDDRITPQMFGAKADGVANDSNAIRLALEACNEAGGGTVYFPKGTYVMGAAANVYSNQHLIGEHGAVLLRADGSTTGLLTADGVSNIIIEDLIFDGGDTAGQQSYSNLIKMTNASDVQITDCEFVHGFSSSAVVDGRNAVKFSGCSEVTVDGCRFAVDSRKNTVSACINAADGSQKVHVTNCVFDSAYACVGATSDVSDIYFGYNKVNDCFVGINIQGSAYLGYAVNNVMNSDSANFYTYKTVYGYGNMLNGGIFFRDTLHPHIVLPYYYTDRVAVPTASMSMKTSAVYTLYNQLTDSTWNDLTDDGENAVLREYVFSTGAYNASGLRGERDTDIKKPVFLVMAGIHGNEKAAVVSAYKFFKDLVDGKNMPTYIPEGAVFKVIPVANPSGFDAAKRENAGGEGVDLNRNFAYGWEPGEEPTAQPETQAITKWLNANKDAVLLLDLHGSGDNSTTEGKKLLKEVAMIVGLKNNEFAKKAKLVSLNGLDRVIPYWKNVAKLKNVTTYAYSSYVDANGGCVYYAADTLGIPAVALELSRMQNGVTSYMAPDTVSTGAEALGNILIEACRQNL